MSRQRRKHQATQSKPQTRAKQTKSKVAPPSTPPSTPPSIMPSLPLANQNRYLILFLLNVIIAFLWQLVVRLFGGFDYLIGFLVGFVLITFFRRAYGQRAYYLAYFIAYVLWQMILSNLSIAKLVLQPRPKLDPGIIGIPLTVTSGLEITVLASVITLTPGTISVDLGHNAAGQRVLYVHNLTVGDPERFRKRIKDGFERLLLRVTQGE